MFKPALVTLALLSISACMQVDGVDVTRDFTGSLNGCPGLTGVSAIYSQSGPGMPVRCGPQAEPPVSYR